MLIYISSGNGVDEVCRGLWHFYRWMQKKELAFEVVKIEEGACQHCYKSILVKSEDKVFLELAGTILWKSNSPFRPAHKRKNWYFSLMIEEEKTYHEIQREKIIYQTMKSPKKGGQHVNTTCSGVRAIYPPLQMSALSYDERSQYQNRKIALCRLLEKITQIEQEEMTNSTQYRWKEGKDLERGNPVKIFEGVRFREVYG
jgi:peptide chain release factor